MLSFALTILGCFYYHHIRVATQRFGPGGTQRTFIYLCAFCCLYALQIQNSILVFFYILSIAHM